MKLDPKKLEIEMARREMGVRDLAAKADISFSAVSKYIRGLMNPKTKPIGKIAKALNVDVTEIIMEERGEDNKKEQTH